MPDLLAASDRPAAAGFCGLVAKLLARKAVTRVLGCAPMLLAVAAFVDAEVAAATARPGPSTATDRPSASAAADAAFIDLLGRYAPA